MRRRLAALALLALASPALAAGDPPDPDGAIRFAAFNVGLARGAPGALIAALEAGDDPRIAAVVEIVQRARPDVLLLNEFDYDPDGVALRLFLDALGQGRRGAAPIAYPFVFSAPVNAGVPSGRDIDGDGRVSGPADAWGWGVFPGQFGMALLSAYPIAGARTFRNLRWAEAPGALRPVRPDGAPVHDDATWSALRLSSKSHWDVTVAIPGLGPVQVLASHPTPPVFDGPEDLNGRRNADEIRFWSDYIAGAGWMTDDAGRAGGLDPGTAFVVLGDLNADPDDGDGRREAIRALLTDPRLADPRPASPGAAAAARAQGGANGRQTGDPALKTADWRDDGDGPGNLRVDYALPSAALTVLGAGVFWPAPGDPLRRLVGDGRAVVGSDHRLVWVDVAR